MSLRRVWAVARKEFIQIVRDVRSIILGIAIPVVLLLLFAYALTMDVDRVPILVWDQSDSALSRNYVHRYAASRFFQIEGHAGNYHDIERAIDERTALAGLVIPRDFAQRLNAGRPAAVQWIVDGSDANTGFIATGYATAVTQAFSEAVQMRHVRRITGKTPNVPLDLRPRIWFNSELESKNYIIPGLIAVIMMVIAALLTSLTVAREWERGTMEQLISTPVKGHELVLGKLIPYFLIGMFDVLLAVVLSKYQFAVPLHGSMPLVFGMGAVFLLGTLSLGLLISILTKNQLFANHLALLTTFIPAFLLSGFAFPITSMPTVVQWVTFLVPARYLVYLYKGIFLKGVGLEVMYFEAGMLALFALVMIALALTAFKKKLV
ncbi:ABC transporter permease [Nitrospina gracilis]|uniref:ABC transporter permease n=1 Tax=Nitrospina gracilis TaxID=35801 RepID=UPI001F1C4623|nr:ABC transporter permease [Nitrospina gracilis]MCF8719904.1 ABC-2 type transport system permease protein [Nitrospina gracilis Nb-211]